MCEKLMIQTGWAKWTTTRYNCWILTRSSLELIGLNSQQPSKCSPIWGFSSLVSIFQQFRFTVWNLESTFYPPRECQKSPSPLANRSSPPRWRCRPRPFGGGEVQLLHFEKWKDLSSVVTNFGFECRLSEFLLYSNVKYIIIQQTIINNQQML